MHNTLAKLAEAKIREAIEKGELKSSLKKRLRDISIRYHIIMEKRARR